MAHTSSAEKRLRQDDKRRTHNRGIKKALKAQIKKFLGAITAAPDTALAEYKTVAKKLDKAAARRVIHPNAAARKKSQLARKLHAKPVAAK